MSEVTDLVLPILQRMQADLADMKRDVSAIKLVRAERSTKFDDLENRTAYETGPGSQDKADLPMSKGRIKAVEQRFSTPETRP